MSKKALWFQIQHPNGAPKKAARRIRSRSLKRAKEERLYRRRSEAWKKGRLCSCAGMRDSSGFLVCSEKQHPCEQVHHLRGRLNGLLLDERSWWQVCASAHQFVHRNPDEARALGLLPKKGQWNRTL